MYFLVPYIEPVYTFQSPHIYHIITYLFLVKFIHTYYIYNTAYLLTLDQKIVRFVSSQGYRLTNPTIVINLRNLHLYDSLPETQLPS